MRSVVRLPSLVLLAALGTTGCAGARSGQATAREFARREVQSVPLQTLDVFVVSRSPVQVDRSLDVDAFPPPEPDQVLVPDADTDAEQRTALEERVLAWTRERGFEARLLRSEKAQPTLQDLLAASEADGVLVVRVVPVDRFGVFDSGSGQEVIVLEPEAQPVIRKEVDVSVRQGRLLVGQAFLFEPRSQIRLWSRQIPDFPDEGRLVPQHPFFAYGFVLKPGAPVPDPESTAQEAAQRFVPAMLGPLPPPHGGDRSVLADIDVQAERTRNDFFDRNHFALEFGAGWGLESISTASQTNQDQVGFDQGVIIPLPDLGTGALAPAGTARLVEPRFTWFTPSAWSFGLRLGYGTVPVDFARSAVVAARSPDDTFEQLAELAVSGGARYGAALLSGRAIWLSERFLFHPELGVFIDVLELDTTVRTVPDDVHVRGGLEAGASIMIRITPVLFVRPRVSGRLGLDAAGSPFAGIGLSGSVGLLF